MQDRNVLLYEPIAARTGPEKPKQLTAASHTCQSGLYLTPPVRFAEARPSNAPRCTAVKADTQNYVVVFFLWGGGCFLDRRANLGEDEEVGAARDCGIRYQIMMRSRCLFSVWIYLRSDFPSHRACANWLAMMSLPSPVRSLHIWEKSE